MKNFQEYINEKEYISEFGPETIEEISNILLNSTIMFYDNREMVEICQILVDLGFNVMSSDQILNDTVQEFLYNCFVNVRNKLWNYDFCVSVEHPTRKSLDYDKFMKLTSKIKKVTNPQLDPYGEENWGYEMK